MYEDSEAMTYYYIGECYEKAGNFVKAIENYHLAIEMDENLPDAWIGAGLSSIELGQIATGMSCIKRAVELEETNPEYWYILGDTQFKHKLFEKAKSSYQVVSELAPSHKDIWLDYSNLYALEDNFEIAIETIRKGIKTQNNNPDLYYRLAVYLLRSEQAKEAYKNIEFALNLNYKKHQQIFNYHPKLKFDQNLLDIIATYKVDQ